MRRGGDPGGCSSQAWHDEVSPGNSIKAEGTSPPLAAIHRWGSRETQRAERATHDRLSVQSGAVMRSDALGAFAGSFRLASAMIASGGRSCACVVSFT